MWFGTAFGSLLMVAIIFARTSFFEFSRVSSGEEYESVSSSSSCSRCCSPVYESITVDASSPLFIVVVPISDSLFTLSFMLPTVMKYSGNSAWYCVSVNMMLRVSPKDPKLTDGSPSMARRRFKTSANASKNLSCCLRASSTTGSVVCPSSWLPFFLYFIVPTKCVFDDSLNKFDMADEPRILFLMFSSRRSRCSSKESVEVPSASSFSLYAITALIPLVSDVSSSIL